MDSESVVEFLAAVPLLQKLPRSSLMRLAKVIKVRTFDKGEYVIREGEVGEGLYIIWEGEAEVSKSMNEEEDRPEFHFQRYDYFGDGLSDSGQQVDVVAMTKLTCLVLPHQHSSLLHSKSIWNAERVPDSIPLAEIILQLEPLDVNLFKGVTLPDAPSFGKVFGGQFVGQALAAATKTVDYLKIVHSLHAYFLRVGDLNMPIIYRVDRIRDGRNFATRRVDALQRGNVVFTLLASFQKDGEGLEHQEITMPTVPQPEMLLSMEELRTRRITDARLPRTYRNKIATKRIVPWPIEIKFCDPWSTRTNKSKSPSSLNFWFRAKGTLSDDQALHRCVVAYASDLIFLQVSVNPHRNKGLKTASVSLDHAVWFHRSVRADDWLLYAIEAPAAHGARGFVKGNMFTTKGEHVATLTQEGLLRMVTPNPATSSKL